VGISGCGAGAVPSKQAKQTSKGLVLGAGAVRVRVQGAKQRLGAVRWWVWCGCKGAGLSQSKV
jgi:hypothetical protein